MEATKKLELAWELNDQDKLGEASRMILRSKLKECSPEEREEINKMAFSLKWMCYYKYERGDI